MEELYNSFRMARLIERSFREELEGEEREMLEGWLAEKERNREVYDSLRGRDVSERERMKAQIDGRRRWREIERRIRVTERGWRGYERKRIRRGWMVGGQEEVARGEAGGSKRRGGMGFGKEGGWRRLGSVAVAAVAIVLLTVAGGLWWQGEWSGEVEGREVVTEGMPVPGGAKAVLIMADGTRIDLAAEEKVWGDKEGQGEVRWENRNHTLRVGRWDGEEMEERVEERGGKGEREQEGMRERGDERSERGERDERGEGGQGKWGRDGGKGWKWGAGRKGKEAGEVRYQTIAIPVTGEYKLVLADGTRVWLNAATRLRFPTAFTGKERKVWLEGEAYFEVARNEEQPFVVATGEMDVRVLGTRFNVKAYKEDGTVYTTLAEGAVKAVGLKRGKTRVLAPNEQCVFAKGTGEMETREVNAEAYIGWTTGKFIFENETLEEILKQLGRWYGTEVTYQAPEVKGYRFTGHVNRFEEISTLLGMIEKTYGVVFHVSGKNITVSKY